MRELKFRVWASGLLIGPYTIDGFRWDSVVENGNIIEQFTGLHDANGTEIYEGDLVQHVSGVYFVEWCTDLGAFVTCDGDLLAEHADPEYPPNDRTIAVIGNIHENPELLEE